MSSLRISCSANCQNSASRSSGRPACSHSLYARTSISCLFGSGIMIAPGWSTVPRFRGLGLVGRTVPDQLGDWPADSSSHEAASSSGTLAKAKARAGVAVHGPLRGLSRSSRARAGGTWQLSPGAPTKNPLNARDAVNYTITAPRAGRPLRRCSAILVLPRVSRIYRFCRNTFPKRSNSAEGDLFKPFPVHAQLR